MELRSHFQSLIVTYSPLYVGTTMELFAYRKVLIINESKNKPQDNEEELYYFI